MQLAVTHRGADFDALASIVAATPLSPGLVHVRGRAERRRANSWGSLGKAEAITSTQGIYLSMRKKTMGIDLEKQQSPVAKGDASAEPNKGAALPKRQDDTQKKGTGKILEEKHSPSDKVDHKYDLLGKILGWIGMGMVLYSIFFLGFFFCKRDCGPAALIVMVIGVLLMGLPLLMESGKSDGEGNVDFDFDFDCDGGGDGD